MNDYFSSLSLMYCSFFRFKFFFKKKKFFYSLNKISFFNLYSNKSLPSFVNSAMDGYALKSFNFLSKDKFKNTKKFVVIDVITAGDYVEFGDFDGDFVVEIMTGARLPSVFDSVVKFEDLFLYRNEKNIYLKRDVKFGENVRFIGEDLFLNDLIICKGEIISFSHFLLFSAFNLDKIYTLVYPKIYLLSTGNEINNLNVIKDINYNNSNIYNSSYLYIIEFFKKFSFDITYMGLLSDNSLFFKEKIKSILFCKKKLSIIITTGAVSKGVSDFILDFILSLKFKVIFHGVKIKPAKPILFASYSNNVYFFGLPGNPVSSIIGVRFFIYPFIRYILGLLPEKPFKAFLVNNYNLFRNKDLFLRSYFFFKKSIIYVLILESQESFKVSSIVESNSFVFLKKNDSSEKGDIVNVYPLNPFYI